MTTKVRLSNKKPPTLYIEKIMKCVWLYTVLSGVWHLKHDTQNVHIKYKAICDGYITLDACDKTKQHTLINH